VKLSKALEKLQEEKDKLEDILKQERNRVKSLEAELGEFRDEILKNKREKNSANSGLKTCKTELDNIKWEKMKMEKTIDDLKNQLKTKNEVLKTKIDEYTDLKHHSIGLAKHLDEIVIELESAKNCGSVENSTKDEVKCSHCDFKCESTVQLNQHIRLTHFKNQVSQTKNLNIDSEISFTMYPCFYCRKVINLCTILKNINQFATL
jgi:chromosome segregation ATPase